MHSLLLRLVALAGLVISPLAHPASGADFHWQGRVAAGQTVEIKGVNGGITAVAASGDQVEVQAVKAARRSDPASVEIKVIEHADGVTVCAVYPSRGGRPNECAAGEGGHMNTDNNDVNVEFTVRVPAGVHFLGRTVNGSVETTELGGNVAAYTVNGGVKIAGAGEARAETVNGSIVAVMGRDTGANHDLNFKTVNGSITLTVPPGLGAELSADTVNGEIESDLPLTVTGKFGRRRVHATLGAGGRALRLSTVNGSIHLRGAR